MCACNTAVIITRYEEEGYQIEQCAECGDCEPEPLDLSAVEEAAYEMMIALEEAAYDDLMESAVVAAGY